MTPWEIHGLELASCDCNFGCPCQFGVLPSRGAIHEGNGQMQLVIDTAATEAQAAALERINTGQDTEEMKTFWFVYAKMSPTKYPTLCKPIDLALDMDARTGRIRIDGVADIDVAPVPPIVTGQPHCAQIGMPNGFEFRQAEVASGRTTLKGGEVHFAPLVDTHAHFARLHLSHAGVIEGAA